MGRKSGARDAVFDGGGRIDATKRLESPAPGRRRGARSWRSFSARPGIARRGVRQERRRLRRVARLLRRVAILDGVSPEVVDAALSGVAYDAAVKGHDHGVASFGSNFASFAASHITPGGVARGKAMMRTYAEPLRTIEQRFGVPAPVLVAIWGLETSFGADNGSFPTFDALATLAWDCRRPERFRAEMIDALMMVQRGLVQHPRQLRGAWAGELGQTQLMPSAYLMFATTPTAPGLGPHPQFRRRSRLDRKFPQKPRLAGGRRLGRRRAELRRHPRMEFRADLRQDRRALRRQACGEIARTRLHPTRRQGQTALDLQRRR